MFDFLNKNLGSACDRTRHANSICYEEVNGQLTIKCVVAAFNVWSITNTECEVTQDSNDVANGLKKMNASLERIADNTEEPYQPIGVW